MMDFKDYFMAKDTVNLTDISLFESQFLFKEMGSEPECDCEDLDRLAVYSR